MAYLPKLRPHPCQTAPIFAVTTESGGNEMLKQEATDTTEIHNHFKSNSTKK